MFVLSFTRYVDGDADTVRRRLADVEDAAPAASSVEVAPVSDVVSEVVVRMRWNARDEVSRRADTLAAARYSAKVFDGALAA